MSTIRQRHKEIIELLKRENGEASVAFLSDQLGVSEVTIRQDLRTLMDEGLVDRTFGGAILRYQFSKPELSFETRMEEAQVEKQIIGKEAATHVHDNFGIFLDGSTTVFAMVPYLKTFNNLTIVTNSLLVAQQFRDTQNVTVLMPSGRMRGETASLVGNVQSIPNINLTLAFFGAMGVSEKAGFSDVDQEEVEMRKAILQRCDTSIVLVDSRKWGLASPYSYARPDTIDHIITTDKAPANYINSFKTLGVSITLISVSEILS